MTNGKNSDEMRHRREEGRMHAGYRDAQQISYEEERRQRDTPWSPAEGRKYRVGSRRLPGEAASLSTPQRAGGHRGKGPKGYRRTDDRLREFICELMTEDEFLDASNIEVEVQDGEVTLNGTVPDRRAKRYAEELAEECSGVLNVQNNLRAEPAQLGTT